MLFSRRDFLQTAAGATGMLATVGISGCAEKQLSESNPIAGLKPMTGDVAPISLAERQGRIEKARRFMAENNIAAIYLEPGSSLFYYTGIRLGRSERMMAAVIPARGEIAYVCPQFGEERLRELILFGDDVRPWEEDESPYRRV
ncbi:MAG: aminopeptidase P family N-terminal domain-containing protein, partial [bacterium]